MHLLHTPGYFPRRTLLCRRYIPRTGPERRGPDTSLFHRLSLSNCTFRIFPAQKDTPGYRGWPDKTRTHCVVTILPLPASTLTGLQIAKWHRFRKALRREVSAPPTTTSKVSSTGARGRTEQAIPTINCNPPKLLLHPHSAPPFPCLHNAPSLPHRREKLMEKRTTVGSLSEIFINGPLQESPQIRQIAPRGWM